MISDLVTLLIPVGAEENASAEAAEVVDTAVPGSEETTRIMKLPGDHLTMVKTEHFANDAEAQALAENMRDENWVKANCHICAPSSPQNRQEAWHQITPGSPWQRLDFLLSYPRHYLKSGGRLPRIMGGDVATG
ncbi:MAG: hypothetical protein Q9211_005428 [Gyalolechia sp. 1 TL-2023]